MLSGGLLAAFLEFIYPYLGIVFDGGFLLLQFVDRCCVGRCSIGFLLGFFDLPFENFHVLLEDFDVHIALCLLFFGLLEVAL